MRTKRLKLLVTLLVFVGALPAQVTTENYVRSRTMLDEAGNSYLDHISYYDGLGRPFQNVQRAIKNGVQVGSILATLQEYDSMGRQSNTWLPIVTTADYVAASAFKSSAPGNYTNDSRPYIQTVYEASPLNKPMKEYAPGVAWYTHPVSIEYMANTSASPLNCINYSVNSSGTLVNGDNYAIGQLRVTKVTDEDGNATYTFTDKLERTLLIRRMKDNEAHDTYYVYDERSNLCFVLQPMYQNDANLDRYTFQYGYDGLNRCVRKKMPGTQYIEYVYDAADRLTFSQDGNQRASGKWTFYEYDNLNRLTCQGECTGKSATTNRVEHIRNFYDNYTAFRSAIGSNSNFPDDTSGNSKGYQTGSIVTVLGTTSKLYSGYYYDIKGRITKKVQSNYMGGYETTTSTYTFSGKPSSVTHVHTASGKPTRTEIYSYTYDHADRLTQVGHTLNGTKVTLSVNTYDNLGRLSTKSLHGSASNRLAYSYNIRNWLSGISSARFTQNLYYNTGNGTAKYNGNISSITWQAGGEGVTKGYKFSYDGLNRLLNATYGEGTSISTNANRFSENVTGYDKNGNIKNLQRYGQTSSSAYGLIDNLSYTLTGNQLNRVDDAVSASAYNNGFEFKNGASAANEYTYDANGNLTKDSNKGISNISYNVLNLPSVVTFSDGSTVTYTYSADGTKLRTVHKTGSATTTTDYCSNVIYENGAQKYLLTKAGYVSLSDGKYHYYLQDHQGNNRVVVDKDGNVEETNHYYPFGGLFASSSSVQPYKYNGKEYDSRKGLNWYDYGARYYDAAVGRWHVSDPSGEKYYQWSPYTYCLNNPAHLVDVNGKDVWVKVQSDGTYRIVGGTRNDDLNIYLVDAQGNRTDNVVGRTLTAYSFYSDKGKVIEGAVINPQDQTGQNFIDKEIIADNPNIMYYMPNAVGGKKYDFKTRGIKNVPKGRQIQHMYRGMPFKGSDDDIAYASARDIGNYGAGYVAGRAGMNWKTARMGFDALESVQQGRLSSEGMTTQKAERMGYEAGSSKNWLRETNDWLKQLLNIPNKTPEGF